MDASLRAHSGFRLLWTGQTVSGLGGSIASLAVPCAFIVQFGASPVQVGLLEAVGFAMVPLFGLLAGVASDRFRRRPLMIWANIVRMLAVASLPVAWTMHAASLPQFFIVAALCGLAGVVFDTAYAAYLPSLIGRERLLAGNAAMAASASAAEIVGGSLAGVLTATCGSFATMAFDAASYGFGTLAIARIAAAEERLEPRSTLARSRLVSLRDDLGEGIEAVLSRPALRSIAACSALSHFGGAMTMAVFYVFLFRQIHLTAPLVGVVLGLSNLGVLGALFAGGIVRRLGRRRTLLTATLLSAGAKMVVPLAVLGAPIVPLVVARLMLSLAGPLFEINGAALRSALVPEALQGRVAATMRTVAWSALPVGSLLGGYLGGSIGLVATMMLGGAVTATGALFLLACPRAEMRLEATPVAAAA